MSVNNQDKSSSILSLTEIFGIVIVFSFVLYLLFPKDNIDQIIEGKSKNTNLSINYLESMLLYYPDSYRIKRILIQNYEYAGELEKALKVNAELLKTTSDKERLLKLYKAEYLLMKEIYFQKEDKVLLQRVKEKLNNYFEYTKGSRDYTFFFAESTQIDAQKLKYVSLKGFLKERPDLINYDFEKDAFIQALSLGYKDDAYVYLLNLLEYSEFEDELNSYALSVLLEHQNYEKVKAIAIKKFLNSKDTQERIKYFNIALHATMNQESDSKKEVLALIKMYEESSDFNTFDIHFLIKSLLEVGEVNASSALTQKAFAMNNEAFDENVSGLAVQSLIYAQKLEPALAVSLFAKKKFGKQQWLDKSIQLSLWLGKEKEAIGLTIEGYRKYDDLKYEHYILTKSTLNNAYEILGEIYKNQIKAGDLSALKKLVEYYEYTGEISKGEEYFFKLSKTIKNKELAKQSILFSYKNSHYKKALALYAKFQKKYGEEKELQALAVEKLITLKKFKKAYTYSQTLKKDKRFYDLEWRERKYSTVFNRLWRLEKKKQLESRKYSKLILLEQALNEGKRLPYLYDKLWKKTNNRSYLTALLYLYLEEKNLNKIEELLTTLKQKDRDIFNQNVQYHIALANYFSEKKEIKKAKNEFEKALKLNASDASTHQAYLWFLLDNELILSLKKEMALLSKNKKLQRKIAFPSVVGALKLQQSDKALRWLKPLLKDSDNIEYQVVYADLLEFQDRVEGAKKVRLKLFKQLNKMLKSNSKLLKDKAFARIYLGLMLRYGSSVEKDAIFSEKFNTLFSKDELLELRISSYAYRQNSNKVHQLVSKNKIDIPWLNLYLAMSLEDKKQEQKLLFKDKDILPFRDRVVASLDIGDRRGAYSLAFQGMEENSRDIELFKFYNEMIHNDYPKTKISSVYKRLTANIFAIENSFSHRWNLYKGLESKILLKHYNYQRRIAKDRSDSSLAFALKNSHQKFLWDFTLASHHSKDDFISANLKLDYKVDDLELSLKTKYQNRTNQTPQLQVIGLENSLNLNLRKVLSSRIQVAVNYKKSKYEQQDKKNIGQSEHLQLSGDYLLRAGYPDMRFNAYVSMNRYDEASSSLLPHDFIEFGSQFSIGKASKGRIQRAWKPFGTVGIAINNHQDIGTSLSMGLSRSVNRADSLSLMLDYSKGIDAIAYPYYGFHLEYQF